MYREDILLWPNGIWCFREELHEYSFREQNYREIAYLSEEWVALIEKSKGSA